MNKLDEYWCSEPFSVSVFFLFVLWCTEKKTKTIFDINLNVTVENCMSSQKSVPLWYLQKQNWLSFIWSWIIWICAALHCWLHYFDLLTNKKKRYGNHSNRLDSKLKSCSKFLNKIHVQFSLSWCNNIMLRNGTNTISR